MIPELCAITLADDHYEDSAVPSPHPVVSLLHEPRRHAEVPSVYMGSWEESLVPLEGLEVTSTEYWISTRFAIADTAVADVLTGHSRSLARMSRFP